MTQRPSPRQIQRDTRQNAAGAGQVYTAREITLQGEALNTQDYRILLELSSSHIACFFFPDLSVTGADPARIAGSLWSAHSKCIEANTSFATAHGYKDRDYALGLSFGELLKKTAENSKLFTAWADQDFSLSNFEAGGESNAHGSGVLLTSIYATREGEFIRKVWIISRDISDRQQTLRSLQKAEEHYRTLVERPGLVLVRTRPNGEYVYITPHIEGITGYRPEDFKGTRGLFSTLLHPDDVLKHDNTILRARSERWRQAVEVEYRLRCRDGAYRWFFERQTPKFAQDGEVEYYDSLAFDIQDRKLLEAKLLHSQRMEVVGALTGGIAHDFNNYLTAILGHLRLALDHLPGAGIAHKSVSGAEQAALRCAEITRDLLAFGRKSDSELSVISLDGLIDETVELLRRLLPSTIEIIVDLQSLGRGVKGNPAQLQQVLLNLAVNARDAMPNGGLLTIRTRTLCLDQLTPSASYPDAAPGEYIEVIVSDTGVGIPDAHMPYLFDPFFTTKPQGKGSGLGLSMVYSIVQSHFGWIHVASGAGNGAVFSFITPATIEPLPRTVRSPIQQICGGNECILVAEDDENVLPMVATALSMHGYSVITARNGEEAIELFRENLLRIDLALIDHTMPKATGREVVNSIRAMAPSVRVILTSGYGELVADATPRDSEFISFMRKPYLIPELLHEVRRLIDVGSLNENGDSRLNTE